MNEQAPLHQPKQEFGEQTLLDGLQERELQKFSGTVTREPYFRKANSGELVGRFPIKDAYSYNQGKRKLSYTLIIAFDEDTERMRTVHRSQVVTVRGYRIHTSMRIGHGKPDDISGVYAKGITIH